MCTFRPKGKVLGWNHGELRPSTLDKWHQGGRWPQKCCRKDETPVADWTHSARGLDEMMLERDPVSDCCCGCVAQRRNGKDPVCAAAPFWATMTMMCDPSPPQREACVVAVVPEEERHVARGWRERGRESTAKTQPQAPKLPCCCACRYAARALRLRRVVCVVGNAERERERGVRPNVGCSSPLEARHQLSGLSLACGARGVAVLPQHPAQTRLAAEVSVRGQRFYPLPV